MRIPRLNLLLILAALMAHGAYAVAEDASHDQSFVCTTLCPGVTCPQSCKDGVKPIDDPNKRTSEGPHQGGYNAVQPEGAKKKNAPEN
jgi:hypothetical protein